jgi:DNA-nicking Smr family endonuclease
MCSSSMVRRKALLPADQRLWAAYAQTLSRLLPGRALPVLSAQTVPQAPPQPPAAAPAVAASAPVAIRPPQRQWLPEVTPLAAPAGLDKSTWVRFANGKLRTVQTLDLHGLTATRAHHATTAFVERAHHEGLRCVEIITGQGEVLVRELPHWLNAPGLRPLILAITHPPANRGATRILIRRRRDAVR